MVLNMRLLSFSLKFIRVDGGVGVCIGSFFFFFFKHSVLEFVVFGGCCFLGFCWCLPWCLLLGCRLGSLGMLEALCTFLCT
jgi:hypothetical protein